MLLGNILILPLWNPATATKSIMAIPVLISNEGVDAEQVETKC